MDTFNNCNKQQHSTRKYCIKRYWLVNINNNELELEIVHNKKNYYTIDGKEAQCLYKSRYYTDENQVLLKPANDLLAITSLLRFIYYFVTKGIFCNVERAEHSSCNFNWWPLKVKLCPLPENFLSFRLKMVSSAF